MKKLVLVIMLILSVGLSAETLRGTVTNANGEAMPYVRLYPDHRLHHR